MKCPRCLADNPDRSRFCGQCASSLEPGGAAAGVPPADMTTPLPAAPGPMTRTSHVLCGEIVPGADP